MNLTERAEVRRETFYKLTNEGALGNLVVESKLSKGWLDANGKGQILGPDTKGERTTDFIQVVAGKTYTFQWWATVAEGQKCWEAWQFYDSNRNPFGARGGYGEYGSDGKQHGKRTITAPANACYIRLSYRSFGNGHMMFEAGAGSASFEPSFDDSLKKSNRNIMQRTDKPFTMGYGITNTTWDDDKKWAYLDLTDPNVNPAKQAEILPQGQFYNFKPTKGMTYTQSILIDTDATFNPYGQPSNTWFTSQGHNSQKGHFEKLSETTYRFWSTYTWQLEDIALRAFDWNGLYGVLGFRTSGTYLAFYKPKLETSDQPSEWSLAPEDLGWSMTTLVPTQSQRYLWKFEYIYYSDGSVEVTSPINISIAGADGTNGQTSHVHFAFADNATGGGFSLTTPKTYMGWYADFNETASNDPTKYKWGKWKGDQGAPGGKGDDGKTSYLHLAFASSADGKTGFSFTESGQQYQGYYTDFTQTSSTDPTKYTWMDRRAGVEVGGVNLLRNSKSFTGSNITGSGALLSETYQGCAVRHLKVIGEVAIAEFRNCVYPKLGGEYVASFWAKGSGKCRIFFYGDNNYLQVNSALTSWGANLTRSDGLFEFELTENWQRYWVKYKLKSAPSSATSVGKHLLFRTLPGGLENDVYLAGCKLEDGNIPTPYTRNPDDVQADIDSKADQALTQQQLNALAEKNRNMEAEMAAKASLAEVERWKQAYDEYVAQNDADKTSAEQKLITLTSRVAEWTKDWEDKKVQWSFLDTNMDFGAEGLRLGKKGSPTSILISNDRIGFYSGGSEVASMSNGTLTIDNGIFAKSLQIGHYREEVYEGDKTINVIRWID